MTIILKKKQLEKNVVKPRINKKYFNYKKKAIVLGIAILWIKKNLKNYWKKSNIFNKKRIKLKSLLPYQLLITTTLILNFI